MLLLHAANIRKYYGDRLILDLPELKIEEHDRIGIVGINGAGKTTLLNILAGIDKDHQGRVKRYVKTAYIRQQDDGVPETLSSAAHYPARQVSEFGVVRDRESGLSGGEKSRLRLALNFDSGAGLLIADEPTSNLDMDGIRLVEEKLKGFRGGILLISHDRRLLNEICGRIIEIDRGRVTVYPGNYEAYRRLRAARYEREMLEYERYVSEKNRLTGAIDSSARRIRNLKKTPSRMGISEARLHRRTTNQIQGNMSTKVKAMETRLEKLEKKERPQDPLRTVMEIPAAAEPIAKTLVRGEDVTLRRGSKLLLEDAAFRIEKGRITALLGPNGCGKSSLVDAITGGHAGIRLARGLKPGVLGQDFSAFDPHATLLDAVMRGSIRSQSEVRTVLARLLFRDDDVFKPFGLLSGGEKLKVALAALLTADVNFLILDEPTNYLDLYSSEAMETVLRDYSGTVLLISHDREFVSNLAERLLVFRERSLLNYQGTYGEYRRHLDLQKEKAAGKAAIDRSMLQMRLAVLGARLNDCSEAEKPLLEAQYRELADEIRRDSHSR